MLLIALLGIGSVIGSIVMMVTEKSPSEDHEHRLNPDWKDIDDNVEVLEGEEIELDRGRYNIYYSGNRLHDVYILDPDGRNVSIRESDDWSTQWDVELYGSFRIDGSGTYRFFSTQSRDTGWFAINQVFITRDRSSMIIGLCLGGGGSILIFAPIGLVLSLMGIFKRSK